MLEKKDRVLKDYNTEPFNAEFPFGRFKPTESYFDYLTDHQLANCIFGDNIRLEGFYEDGGALHIVISQPFVTGLHLDEVKFVNQLKKQGLQQVPGSLSRSKYYLDSGPAGKLLITDLHEDNAILGSHSHLLEPIDVHFDFESRAARIAALKALGLWQKAAPVAPVAPVAPAPPSNRTKLLDSRRKALEQDLKPAQDRLAKAQAAKAKVDASPVRFEERPGGVYKLITDSFGRTTETRVPTNEAAQIAEASNALKYRASIEAEHAAATQAHAPLAKQHGEVAAQQKALRNKEQAAARKAEMPRQRELIDAIIPTLSDEWRTLKLTARIDESGLGLSLDFSEKENREIELSPAPKIFRIVHKIRNAAGPNLALSEWIFDYNRSGKYDISVKYPDSLSE